MPRFEIWVLSVFILSVFAGYFLSRRFFRRRRKKIMPVAPITHCSSTGEMEMAKRVQEALLSIELPDIAGISVARKAVSAASIGGDFYQMIHKSRSVLSRQSKVPGVIEYRDSQEESLGICIGDVAGHGISSALVMALSAGVIHNVAHSTLSAAQTLQKANDLIATHIQNSHVRYVTAIYAIIHLAKKTITYAMAGHPPFLLLRDGAVEELKSEGIFMGMYPDESYTEASVAIRKDDRLVFYTDGITESKNAWGEEFGLERLKSLLIQNASLSPTDFTAYLFEQLRLFSGTDDPLDDQTLVVVDITE